MLYPEGGYFHGLYVVNQDGSGNRIINQLECDDSMPVAIQEDSGNRLVMVAGKVVLTNLDHASVQAISPGCRTKFTGGTAGGLLATLDPSGSTGTLRVYKLPEGKLLNSFPVTSCSRPGLECNFETASGTWVAEWDPSGKALIFPAILDNSRSDLYLYDAQNGALRQLASIEGRVSRIWWSPGGTNIVLGISPDGDLFLESIWTVPVARGVASRLTTAEEPLADVEILDWLDEDRFLFYNGSLQNVVTAGAFNLRMLDIRSGQENTIFGDGFLRAGVDRQTGTVGMIVAVYNTNYEDGVYLVHVANPTPQKIAPVETEGIYNTSWDERLGLFVTGDPCQDGGQGLRAFDSHGRWQCTPVVIPAEPTQIVDSPSPDGRWRATMKDGLWVESIGKSAVKVLDETPTQVIWRPDSGGFFFMAGRHFSYISLPDLAVLSLDRLEQLDKGLSWGSDQVEYQWIENANRR